MPPRRIPVGPKWAQSLGEGGRVDKTKIEAPFSWSHPFRKVVYLVVELPHSTLFVEKILAADLVEGGERLRPALHYLFRRHAGLQLLHGIRVSNELDHLRNCKLFRVKFLENCRDFQSRAHRAHFEAIRNLDGNAAAALSTVQSRNRNEQLPRKTDARKTARIQRRRHFIAVHPRRSKFLERSLRAATHGDSGALQDFDPRIKNRSLGRAEIRRGRNPFDARALKKIVAMPVSHGDDVQIGTDVIFGVEKLRELPDRDRKSTRLNSSHRCISYAVFCLKK